MVKAKTATIAQDEFDSLKAMLQRSLDQQDQLLAEHKTIRDRQAVIRDEQQRAVSNGKATDAPPRIVAEESPAAAKLVKTSGLGNLPRGVVDTPHKNQRAEYAGDNRVRADFSSKNLDVQVKDYKTGVYSKVTKKVNMKQDSRDMLFAAAGVELPELKLAILDKNGDPTDCIITLPLDRSVWGQAGDDETGETHNVGNVQWGKKGVEAIVNVDGHNYVLNFNSMYGIATKCLG